MNWFKKLFSGTTNSTGPGAGAVEIQPSLRSLRPSRDVPVVEAKRISTENVREWCDRLEREGNRKGDRRMIAQAQNIRARLT